MRDNTLEQIINDTLYSNRWTTLARTPIRPRTVSEIAMAEEARRAAQSLHKNRCAYDKFTASWRAEIQNMVDKYA